MAGIQKLFIANRGEIAVRIMRTCRRLGIVSAVPYPQDEAQAIAPRTADEAVLLPDLTGAAAYLDVEALIAAAQRVGADAVHPGYGFLSENAHFAARCREAGLIFVGPDAETIAVMGNKARARALAQDLDAPVPPGLAVPETLDAAWLKQAKTLTPPLLLKPIHGGGGIGMHVVRDFDELPAAVEASRAEALAAFGQGDLALETYFTGVRHIEVQLIGDSHGRIVLLGDRECSIQRRRQKLIEEAPAPNLPRKVRTDMRETALKLARAVNYVGAGTIEFLYNPADERFFFLEMNTRLQVEHTVTEQVFDVDLVALQIAVAEGAHLETELSERVPRGHALECRLYAEDPARDFSPSPGDLAVLDLAEDGGVRWDAGVAAPAAISADYDPLLAKLVVYGTDRARVCRRAAMALRRSRVLGLQSNRFFLANALLDETFLEGKAATDFVDLRRHLTAHPDAASFLAVAARVVWGQRYGARALPQEDRFHFSLGARDWEVLLRRGQDHDFEAVLLLDGRQVDLVRLTLLSGDLAEGARVRLDGVDRRVYTAPSGDGVHVQIEGRGDLILDARSRFDTAASGNLEDGFHAGLPGKITAVTVGPGDTVSVGQTMVVLTSMKMEHRFKAGRAGKISAVHVAVGDVVDRGALLVELEDM